jgi:medium-chain acyl-[acyl-carrier-protein] hydrolase
MKNSVRLYCLPCAGGLASIYYKWRAYLSEEIELVPIELAGKGQRWEEHPYQGLNEAVADVYENIRHSLNERPYAIWGHSMGAIIAYELAHRIRRSSRRNPEHLLLAGHKAPHIRGTSKNLHRLSDEEFKQEILALGGTPNDIFINKELAAMFIPILKSDYRILETYEYKPHSDRLDCNISIFYGSEDTLFAAEDAAAWEQLYTARTCDIYGYTGGHFFIHEQAKSVVEKVNNILNRFSVSNAVAGHSRCNGSCRETSLTTNSLPSTSGSFTRIARST